MLTFLEHIYAKFIARFWSVFPSQKLASIRRFQAIEADGVWHLYQILKNTDSPKERAKIFQHILEEDSHAELFQNVYSELAPAPFQSDAMERKELTSTSASWEALLYVHLGEMSATRRFNALKVALPRDSLQSALEKIVCDEEGHISLTEELAYELQVTERSLRVVFFRIFLERFVNVGKQFFLRVINQLGLGLLMVGYWIFGMIGAHTAKSKLAQRFISINNNRLKIFNA